jgi:predicted AAA+ superfamily ATPase
MSDKKTIEENHFQLIEVTSLEDIISKKKTILSTSDLSLQSDTHIAQFKYVESKKKKERKKIKIVPGCFTLISTMAGTDIEPFTLKSHNLLESIDNTKTIKGRANQFFENLDIYEELGVQKVRNILLYSDPGFGKSSAINSLCQQFMKEDPNTVVINWNTSSIKSSSVESFFSLGSEFDDKVTRMVFIIEDIGGGEQEFSGNRSVDSSLLGLLDGNSVTFKVPTFTIATTNYPGNLLSALADRPGRFDEMIKLPPPSAAERVALAEHIGKRKLTEKESTALSSKKVDNQEFSIAHIKEIVIRSRLTGKSFEEIIKDMIAHKEKFKKGFSEQKSMGMGSWD